VAISIFNNSVEEIVLPISKLLDLSDSKSKEVRLMTGYNITAENRLKGRSLLINHYFFTDLFCELSLDLVSGILFTGVLNNIASREEISLATSFSYNLIFLLLCNVVEYKAKREAGLQNHPQCVNHLSYISLYIQNRQTSLTPPITYLFFSPQLFKNLFNMKSLALIALITPVLLLKISLVGEQSKRSLAKKLSFREEAKKIFLTPLTTIYQKYKLASFLIFISFLLLSFDLESTKEFDENKTREINEASEKQGGSHEILNHYRFKKQEELISFNEKYSINKESAALLKCPFPDGWSTTIFFLTKSIEEAYLETQIQRISASTRSVNNYVWIIIPFLISYYLNTIRTEKNKKEVLLYVFVLSAIFRCFSGFYYNKYDETGKLRFGKNRKVIELVSKEFITNATLYLLDGNRKLHPIINDAFGPVAKRILFRKFQKVLVDKSIDVEPTPFLQTAKKRSIRGFPGIFLKSIIIGIKGKERDPALTPNQDSLTLSLNTLNFRKIIWTSYTLSVIFLIAAVSLKKEQFIKDSKL